MSVAIEIIDQIAVVTIENPPVNAAGLEVRQGLWEAVDTLDADPQVEGVVLACAGRTFVAGADIREFGKPPVEPHLPDVLNKIEGAQKPWVAAIHGTALGGGLELAMSCHGRVALSSAKMGLPEVNLGLIPGAGGTVRLPRLVPPTLALTMAAGGKPIAADQALKAGLVDEVVAEGLEDAARTRAKTQALTPTLARDVQGTLDEGFDKTETGILRKARGQKSPKAASEAIRRGVTMEAPEALAAERAAFTALKQDPQSAALRHIFFAERAVGRSARTKGVTPRALNQIGVIGGGTMGAGIAAACLLAGLKVTMIERDAGAAQAGHDRVAEILGNSLKRGLISEDKHTRLMGNFLSADSYDALSEADLVIEAVFEDMGVKREVFAKLDEVTRPDAVLASNTSYLDVNEIAASVRDPSRVLGLHFFSPAHIMKLLEIVVPEGVADDVLATGIAFGKQLKKISVLAGVCDGFIANRIMSAYRRECEYMLEDGALPHQIDAAMEDFGFPMGIYRMQDLAGLDIAWAMRKRQAATRDPAQRYVDIADKLCEAGRIGQKAGRGWYIYEDGKPVQDTEVEELIVAESARKGISRQNFDAAQIMVRILGCMQREGRAILDEGIAASPEDVDVVMINAFGFPRWHGGPMFMAHDK